MPLLRGEDAAPAKAPGDAFGSLFFLVTSVGFGPEGAKGAGWCDTLAFPDEKVLFAVLDDVRVVGLDGDGLAPPPGRLEATAALPVAPEVDVGAAGFLDKTAC